MYITMTQDQHHVGADAPRTSEILVRPDDGNLTATEAPGATAGHGAGIAAPHASADDRRLRALRELRTLVANGALDTGILLDKRRRRGRNG